MAKQKIIINIDTLNLTVGSSSDVLNQLLAAANRVQVAHVEPANDESPAPAAEEQQAQVSSETHINAQHVLDFLKQDPRYSKRSFQAIDDHFENVPAPRLRDLLQQMWSENLIDTVTRRSDGAVLYYVLPEASAEEDAA